MTEQDRTDLKAAIITIIRSSRGVPVSQPWIAENVEPAPTKHQVRMACQELERDGVIQRPPGGARRWVLAGGER